MVYSSGRFLIAFYKYRHMLDRLNGSARGWVAWLAGRQNKTVMQPAIYAV